MSRVDSLKMHESKNDRSAGRLLFLSRALILVLAACLVQPLVAVPAVAADSFGANAYTRGAIRIASGQYLSFQFNSIDVTNGLTFNASATWSIAFHMNVTKNDGGFSNFFTAVDSDGLPVFALGGGTGATVLRTYTCSLVNNTCSSTDKKTGTPVAGTMSVYNSASYPYRWEINQDANQVCVNRSTSASFGRDDYVAQDCYSKISSNKKIARIVIGGTPQTDARTYTGAVRTFDISNVLIKNNLPGVVNTVYTGLTNTVQDQYFAQNEYSSPVDSVFLLQTYNTDITDGGSTNYLKNSSSLATQLTSSLVVPTFTTATSALAPISIPTLHASPLVTTSGPNTGSDITIRGTNLQGVNKVKWGLEGSTLSNATLISTSNTEVKFNMPPDTSLVGSKNITFAVSTPAGSLSANSTFRYTSGTSIIISASNLTPSIGSSITLSSTISAAGSSASDASGTVTFKDDANNTLCVDTSITTGTASCLWTPPLTSTYTVQGIYSGDLSF